MDDDGTVDEVIPKYSGHPRVQNIKREFSLGKEFESAYPNDRGFNQIIKSLNVNKAKDPDGISAKFVKMSADVTDCHIANIINRIFLIISFLKMLKL